MSCVNCETLKDNINNLELMLATADQENRQLHARNQRLIEEINYANKLLCELAEAHTERVMPMSYNQIKESFSR